MIAPNGPRIKITKTQISFSELLPPKSRLIALINIFTQNIKINKSTAAYNTRKIIAAMPLPLVVVKLSIIKKIIIIAIINNIIA